MAKAAPMTRQSGEEKLIRSFSKDARLQRERRFLLRELPPELTRASPHLQITDNFITNTRLRLRQIREPLTRERVWMLTQKFALAPPDLSSSSVTDLYLTEYEYEVLAVFEGNEIRKNRYPYEHESRTYAIDIYLGALRGLILAKTSFKTDDELNKFSLPPFAVLDVSNDEMFTGARLVNLTVEDILAELKRRDERTGGV